MNLPLGDWWRDSSGALEMQLVPAEPVDDGFGGVLEPFPSGFDVRNDAGDSQELEFQTTYSTQLCN